MNEDAPDALAILPRYAVEASRQIDALQRKLLKGKRSADLSADASFGSGEIKRSYAIEEGGFASIPISGPLYDFPAWIELWLPGLIRTYEGIRRQVAEANADPEVTGIRLVINSPGGHMSGCFETQEMLSSSSKPVVEARCEAICASAAYLLACAAEKITGGVHSSVGCVGTILTIHGNRGMLAKLGITRETFVSAVSPHKNTDPEDTGDQGRAQLQAWVDRLGQELANRIAKLRGVSVQKVITDYGKGDVLVGADALKAGVIDEIRGGATMADDNNESEDENKNPDGEAESEAEGAGEGESEGEGQRGEGESEGEGANGEGESEGETEAAARIKAIDDLKIVGYDEEVYQAKYVTKLTAVELKARLFDLQRGRQTAALGGLKDRARNKPNIAPANPEGSQQSAEQAQAKSAAREAKAFRRG